MYGLTLKVQWQQWQACSRLPRSARLLRTSLTKRLEPRETEQAVVSKLAEIQNAAQELDADKVFSFVLENNEGALVTKRQAFSNPARSVGIHQQGFRSLRKWITNSPSSVSHCSLFEHCPGDWRRDGFGHHR
jgi:hypothetical protein